MNIKKVFATIVLACVSSAALATDYQVMVPMAVGISADTITRKIADVFARNTGNSLTVQNMPGADGIVGITHWKNSKNMDILVYGQGAIVYEPAINNKLPYDDSDFNYVINITSQPGVWVTRPDTNLKTPKDLLTNMPEFVGGYATSWNQNPLVFGKEKKLKTKIVPYKGGNEAIQALLGKQLDLVISGNSATIMSLVKAGKLHIVGTTYSADYELDGIKFLSVSKRTGVPGFGSGIGIAFKSDTDPYRAAYLKKELWKAVQDPGVQTMIANLGYMNDSSDNEKQNFQNIINLRNNLKKQPITSQN